MTTSDRGDRMTDVRLWDAGTGVPASPVMSVPGRSPLVPAIFKPDGDAPSRFCPATTRSVSMTSPTARPLGVVGTLRNECVAPWPSGPTARSLVAVQLPGIVHKWPIPEPSVGTVGDLVRHVQLRTDCELDSRKLPVVRSLPISGDSFSPSPNGASFMPETTDEAVWHETNARDAEAAGDSFGFAAPRPSHRRPA